MAGAGEVRRAVRACRTAGLPVIDVAQCTCALRGRLVVVAGPDGLRVVWPYDHLCPIHRPRRGEEPQPAKQARAERSRSQAPKQERTRAKASGR